MPEGQPLDASARPGSGLEAGAPRPRLPGKAGPPPRGSPVRGDGAVWCWGRMSLVGWLLSNYGWYLLFSLVILYLLFQKLSGKFRVMGQRSLGASETSSVEPDVVVKQQEALIAARLRMQEELNKQAEKYKEKLKQLEEEKRRQKIEMWESMQEGKSYKGSAKKQPEQKPEPGPSSSSTIPKPKPERKPLRSGYNPLSGEGGGTCSWRPGRRGPSSGG